MLSREIKAHMIRFNQSVAKTLKDSGVDFWPWTEADVYLYARLAAEYKGLAELLEVDCDRLIPECRHRFFVCTEPVEMGDGQKVRGLSDLEKMMGMKYSDSAVRQVEPSGTGDEELDALVSAALVFGDNAELMLSTLGIADLAKSITFASYLKDPKRSEEGEVAELPDAAPPIQDSEFARVKPLALAKLNELGVEPPPGF